MNISTTISGLKISVSFIKNIFAFRRADIKRLLKHSIQSLFKSIVLKLKALYPDAEARAMADRLIEHYLDLTPAQRVLSATTPVESNQLATMREAVNRLLHHVPLQYITGKAYFIDLEFVVNPDKIRSEQKKIETDLMNVEQDIWEY